MSKTIFITGASTGLGKAAALLIANCGWKVIATMPNPEAVFQVAEVAMGYCLSSEREVE